MCDRPQPAQWLHLLVVGVGDADKDQLAARVRRLLETTPTVNSQPVSGAFEEVRLTTLPTYFTRDGLSTRLRTISREIQKQIKAGRPNHVVMIYYHGSQARTAQGTFFDTPESLANPKLLPQQTGIAWDSLTSFFEGNLGAQLLVLDVANSKYDSKDKDMVVQGDKEPNVGVVRITRMNGGALPRDVALQGIEAQWPKSTVLGDFTFGLAAWSQQQPELKVDNSVAADLVRLVLNRTP